MEIDINNYESVLIDYFDGNLNALEVAEVLIFLEQHPEIKREFESIGILPQPQLISVDEDFKLQLKKLNEDSLLGKKSFNELIIATIEGDCNELERTKINQIIEGNASLLKLKKLLYLTKLTPDLQIKYPDKESLKKEKAAVFYLTRNFAVAAAMLLLATLSFLIYRNANHEIEPIQLAQTAKPFIKQNNSSKEMVYVKEISSKTESKVKDLKQKDNVHIALHSGPSVSYISNTVSNHKITLESLPLQPLAEIKTTDIAINASIENVIQAINFDNTSLTEKEEKFLTISNWVKLKLIERGKKNLVENENPMNQEELNLDPITVASLGAGIVEKTTGKKVYLSRSFDKAGSIKSYTFAAGNFKFERIK
jgi:hypothetical protein